MPKICEAKGVALEITFPGCAESDATALAACVDRSVQCRVCLALNRADNLAVDCDLFDDRTESLSCP